MGGFPIWTLAGMGLAGFIALLIILAAYLAQSPSFLHRFRLVETRFSRSGRRLTGMGLAFLLLAFGFFLAGVPVTEESTPQEVAVATQIIVVTATPGAQTETDDSSETAVFPTFTPTGPAQTGAFALPDGDDEDSELEEAGSETEGGEEEPFIPTATPEEEEGETSEEEAATSTPTVEDEEVTGTPTNPPTPRPTNTPTATNTPSPTPTSSPTPTNTPTPTLTPTPVVGINSIEVNILGSITWIYRVPGNQRLETVSNGDELILESGRAIQGGIEWQEVRTLSGIRGWIEVSAILPDEVEEEEG